MSRFKHENLLRAGVHGETGQISMRALEVRGRGGVKNTRLFDVAGKPIKIKWGALGRVPATRDEVASRINLLRVRKARITNSGKQAKALKPAIVHLQAIMGVYSKLAKAKDLREATRIQAKHISTYNAAKKELDKLANDHPKLKDLSKTLGEQIRFANTAGESIKYSRGIRNKNVIQRGEGRILMKGASGVELFLSNSVSLRKETQRRTQLVGQAISEITASLDASESGKQRQAKLTADINTEISLLLNAAKSSKGRTYLPPKELSKVYKFYRDKKIVRETRRAKKAEQLRIAAKKKKEAPRKRVQNVISTLDYFRSFYQRIANAKSFAQGLGLMASSKEVRGMMFQNLKNLEKEYPQIADAMVLQHTVLMIPESEEHAQQLVRGKVQVGGSKKKTKHEIHMVTKQGIPFAIPTSVTSMQSYAKSVVRVLEKANGEMKKELKQL
jgi:hypothetical protein